MSASKTTAKNGKGIVNGGAKGKPAAKKPAAKVVLALNGGVTLYGGAAGTHGTGCEAMPFQIGKFGRDGFGNSGGCVPFNRALCALIAQAKPGDKVTMAMVQPLSEALAEAGGLEPAETGAKGNRARNRAANSSHVNTLRARRVLLADDAFDCPPGETPAARGELKLTKGGEALAKAAGMLAPLTAAEKAALAAYSARIVKANKAAKGK